LENSSLPASSFDFIKNESAFKKAVSKICKGGLLRQGGSSVLKDVGWFLREWTFKSRKAEDNMIITDNPTSKVIILTQKSWLCLALSRFNHALAERGWWFNSMQSAFLLSHTTILN